MYLNCGFSENGRVDLTVGIKSLLFCDTESFSLLPLIKITGLYYSLI